jgi:hypothetical protein
MTTPAGTTQLQADLIFYGQVAAGALVGYTAGQTLTSSAEAITKFGLSRQDRGTAGVDTQAILAIVNTIPTISGVPSLINVPLTNPINQADLVNINSGDLSPDAIGPLSSTQVQGILAQIANLVDQAADVMSDDKGVGQYGLSCVQLEQAGYVKPGSWQRFIFDPAPLTQVLASPGIWTGRDGVTAAAQFLSSPNLQTNAQVSLLNTGYNGLVSAGVISPSSSSAISASLGQVYTQSGLQSLSSLSALTGASLSVPASISTALAGTPIASLLSSPITNVTSIASGAINQLTGGISSLTNLSGLASSLNNTAIGDVSALVANAGRFGTAATAAWSQVSNLPGLGSLTNLTTELPSLSSITGALSSFGSDTLGSLSGSLNGLVGDLGGSLSSLTSSLDITGKAGQFAAAFSDPLASLSNLGNFDLSSLGNLGSLGDLSSLTGSLSNLGSLTGSLGSLTGSLGSLTNLTGSLGSLGSLTSSLGSLSSLTGSLGSLSSLGSLANFGGLGALGAIGGLFGGGGDELVSSTQVAAGYSNTVNRGTLDVALLKIIGSPKVPLPIFEYPSPGSISLNANKDILAASNILQNLRGLGGTVLAQANQITNAVNNASGQIGQIGGVISNALNRFV